MSNNGDNDFFVDNVTIGSVPTEPIFSVTPTAHSFGDVNLNASRSKTISVSNLGIGTLGINSISISGDDCFTLSEVPELPASVELGSPLSFNVLFAPQELGNFSATITIVGDLQRVAHSVSVTGSGVNVITVGTGLQNAQIPLDFNWKNSLFETLYYPSELDGFVGLITGIRFYNQFVTTTLTNKPTRIWLGTTALNDLSTEWIPSTELTLVFDGVLDYPAGQNTISIDFPEPFLYVDGQNLVMLAQRPMDTGYFSSSDYFKAQTVGTNRSRKVRSDETLYDPANPPTENVSVSGQFPKTTFTVIPGGIGHISGTVYGLNNLPLQGVQVVVSESRYAAITGEDGTFFIRNVLPGNYTVSCSIYGYENYQTTISLEEDETEQLDIQMIQLPMMVVSGTIQANDSSSGLEGASISLKGYKNYTVLSVADGSFSIPDVYANNSYQFQISKNGYVKQTGTISVSLIDYSMGIIVLNEIAYSPHTLIATLNNPMNRVELSWTAPDPNATGIYQSFEAATFPPQGWSQTITNNGAALANGVHPTWCRVSNISSGSTQVNPTEGSYQAGLWWTYTHQDEWLSTTAFTCPSDAVLSFDSYVFLGSTNDDHYYVKLSLDGGNSWSVIWDASANTGGWNTYSAPIAIDLALYAGMQIRIAFHADDPPADSGLFYHWFIDNVFVGNEHQRLSNTSASRGLVGYKLWRFGVQEQEQPELWTLLTPDPISQNSYYDTSWSEAVEGNYRWAVKAVYAADVTSATAISGTLTKLSDAPSTPENVKIEVSDSNVLISWDPVSTDLMGNPIEVSYYEVHFFTDDFSFVTNPFSLLDITTETSYFLEGITADIDFIFFRIVAVSGVRASFSKDEGLKRLKSAIAKKKAN